jgi:hypothetical protein
MINTDFRNKHHLCFTVTCHLTETQPGTGIQVVLTVLFGNVGISHLDKACTSILTQEVMRLSEQKTIQLKNKQKRSTVCHATIVVAGNFSGFLQIIYYNILLFMHFNDNHKVKKLRFM